MDIKVSLTENSHLSGVDFNNIPFGKIFADHMFSADFSNGTWSNFEITPVHRLSVHPAMMALHYGQSIFEGMKASMTVDNTPVLFRPDLHAKRLNVSAERMCMPTFPEDMFLEAISKLVAIDKEWIPRQKGSTLYIRPLMFSTDEFVGVRASEKYKLIIITLPVGPYYSKPVSLLAETTYTRAAQGGVGETKCSGNYGRSLYPQMLARQQGYDQVLWLDAKEFKYIQEVGTMNIFFVIGDKLITPATTGTILKGVTRASIIEIAEDRGIDVDIRRISIDEVVDAYNSGDLHECFGAGTAALVAHVDKIKYKEHVMELPKTTEMSKSIKDEINGLRDGTILDTRGWIYPITQDVLV